MTTVGDESSQEGLLRSGLPTNVHRSSTTLPLRMLQVEVFDPCMHCHATGRIGISQPYCLLCGHRWTPAHFNQYYHATIRGQWRGWRRFRRLECGHKAVNLRYSNPLCPNCAGEGGEWRRVPLNWLAGVLQRLS